MAREKANKKRGVQFTHESAKQIAEVVRTAGDQGRGHGGLGRSHAPQASSHYLSQTTATWTKGTSQTLTIHVGTPGSEAAVSGQTVTAWNHCATIPAGVRVLLARGNSTFYLASFDLHGLTGFSASKQQILSHAANGGLVWLDTTDCT